MYSLQSHTIFLSPPKTFNELNERLNTCVEHEGLHPLRLKNFSKDQKQSKYIFTLDQVLSAMRFPIEAYTDVNPQSIALWQRCMIQLFPINKMNDKEKATFSLFCKNIPMYAAAPVQIDPRTVVKYPGKEDTFDPLPDLIDLYKLDPKERLTLALTHKHTPKNLEELAKKLQVILNALLMEQELLIQTLERGSIFKQFRHCKKLYHKDHTVVPSNFFSDHVYFAEADLIGPEDPANLPFFLQIQSTMKSVVHQVHRSLSEKSAVRDQELDEVIKKLEKLNEVAKNSHPRWSIQIERCLNLVKSELLAFDYGVKAEAMQQFFADCQASPLFTDPNTNFPDAEDVAIPFAIWQMKKHHNVLEVNKELIRNPLTTKPYGEIARNADQEAIDRNGQTWLSLQTNQQALYREAYSTLQDLIKKNKFKNFHKRLFGKGDLPSELPLKTVPSLEQLTPHYQKFFAPSEIMRRAEPPKETPQPKKPDQKQTVASKAPEAPPPALPGKEPPMVFDDRVSRWQNHPADKPLSREVFGDKYASASIEYQQKMIAYHSFSVLADRFFDYGIKGTWLNPTTKRLDTQYIIAADLQRKGLPVERGMVILSIDPDNICYHKYFHQKMDREIVRTIIEETFYLSDFPTLEESMKIGKAKEKKASPMSSEGETLEIDPVLGSVTINNPRLDLKITLHRSSLFDQ